MRALIVALFPFILLAEPASFALNYLSASQSGNTNERVTDQTREIDYKSTNLNYSSGLIKDFYRLRFSLTQTKQDLSNYTIRAKSGKEASLAETYDGAETSFNLGHDLSYKNFTLGLDFGQSLSSTPLKKQKFAPTLSYQIYDLGMNFSYQYNYQKSSRPETYVTNPEKFTSDALSTRTHKIEHIFTYDQLINEYIKSSLSFKQSQVKEDRPVNFGGKIQLFFAPVNDLGFSMAYENAREKKDDLPKDGSGYYSLDSYEAGVSLELYYRYLLTLNYATVIERETARGLNPNQEIGTDAISFTAEVNYKNFAPYLRMSFEESNSGRSAQTFQGGLTWQI